MTKFTRGIAFICEGQTERVFYHSMLDHYLSKHSEYCLEEELDSKTNEYQLVIKKDQQAILIKTFTVGTIITHTHAPVSWFKNNCKQQYC